MFRGTTSTNERGCRLVPTKSGQHASGVVSALDACTLVGRSRTCHIRFDETYVSTTHCMLRWAGDAWLLKDLGSRNGTFVNNRRLSDTETARLELDDIVAFGAQPEASFRVELLAPPAAAAISLGGQGTVYEENGLILLPSERDPWATLYSTQQGWMLETEAPEPIQDGRVISGPHGEWRFHLPEILRPTEPLESRPPASLLECQLVFLVSDDEEHVEVRVVSDGKEHSMGSRACFYLLLTLARHRRQTPHDSEGWILAKTLQDMLRVTTEHLNINIFRIRQHFAELGLPNAGRVIERCSRPGRLRIGPTDFTIARMGD